MLNVVFIKVRLLKKLYKCIPWLTNVTGEKSEHNGTIARLFQGRIRHFDELEILHAWFQSSARDLAKINCTRTLRLLAVWWFWRQFVNQRHYIVILTELLHFWAFAFCLILLEKFFSTRHFCFSHFLKPDWQCASRFCFFFDEGLIIFFFLFRFRYSLMLL